MFKYLVVVYIYIVLCSYVKYFFSIFLFIPLLCYLDKTELFDDILKT